MSFEEDYAPYNDGDSYDEMDVRFGWDLRNHEVHCLTMALRKVEAERDALKARIEGGVRVEILADNLELKGKVTMALFNSDKSNAMLILDEEAEL